jgi:hypothetical protein
MKIKISESKLGKVKYKMCSKCDRDITVNECVLHTSSKATQECYHCHLQKLHIVKWIEDKGSDIVETK